MKKFFLLLVFIAAAKFSNAQVSVSDSLKSHYQKTYQQAMLYNDVAMAINSMQNIIAETNGNAAIELKDTLAMLYFATKSYYSALILSKEVHDADPKNINAQARGAECYQNLGDIKNAIKDYEVVAPILKSPYYYYQLAACQYNMKRFGECEANINKVLADTNSNKVAVTFILPNGNEQQVPASAAVLNMAGIMKMDAKNFAEAKTYLENALKLYPDFEGARQNLAYCNDNLKGKQSKTPAAVKPKGKG